MANSTIIAGFHDAKVASNTVSTPFGHRDTQFTYTFENFFHPLVGELIAKLNTESLPGIFDSKWQEGLRTPDPETDPTNDFFHQLYDPQNTNSVHVRSFPKEIDVSGHGSYANYNWELFFHIPLTIAVHLSKTQRFAEAQRWFHFIFDPTSNDQSVDPAKRFWNFLAFRKPDNSKRIEKIVQLLSTPRSNLPANEQSEQDEALNGYTILLNRPFQPHAVARTRHLAYQFSVVMKYLDNLIAWGDNLFLQDTVESINEATQIYVLAANILGERPRQIPPRGKVKARTFAELKDRLGPIGNALVDLEVQFPFNSAVPNPGAGSDHSTSPLSGIGRTLYFCVPPNDKLLGYWNIVADRLFKIRHCMNIAGIVRQLPLFDPPIDPGMLVKAAAAGIDIGSIVSGLNQPIGPVRSLILIQKALELCSEVRNLGNALLSALEKGDAEHLALTRQRHEVLVQQIALEVRFLQFRSAQETTRSLLTSRATALERLRYYQRLLGLPADPNAPDVLTLDQATNPTDPPKLNQDNFDDVYNQLVSQYDKRLTLQSYPFLKRAGVLSPAIQSGASGQGNLYLNTNEDVELNSHLPTARDSTVASSISNALAAGFAPVPDADADFHFWGIGGKVKLNIGTALVAAAKIAGDIFGIIAGFERDQAGMASRTASYERRADEWILQYNLAAHEMMQIGRQILTSLIAEQVAQHEYRNIWQQITNAQEIDKVLHDKFTNEDLYLWMQGEIERLYNEYYRFALDTARKAERAMKQELMRQELYAQDFIKFNYGDWEKGRKGLLSGEALYLDVKRMEMAYHENNKREIELTKHVSLRLLNPVALLTLKATGTCQVTVPEWLYDLDCPGHYMRRIKSVALSVPSVVGPYNSINCTLSLLKSSLRKSPLPDINGAYARQGSEDDRFVNYIGAVQSIVTSSGQSDSGMFETNLHDDRLLPFEGAGAESTWKLDLPNDYRTFDYNTISDIILHIRYTARQGVVISQVNTALDNLFRQTTPSNLALVFSLRHDFPTEWSAFVNGSRNFTATIRKDYFPYFVQYKTMHGGAINITEVVLYDGNDVSKHHTINTLNVIDNLRDSQQALTVNDLGPDEIAPVILKRDANAQVFLIIRYSLG